MRLLLDTNVLLWWLAGGARLGAQAYNAIADARNVAFVSAASGWEIAIKVGLGKLDVPPDVAAWLPAEIDSQRFSHLPIALRHALAVEQLPLHHRDPFDRVLIAQAQLEGLTIVTGDEQMTACSVPLILC